MQRKYNKKQLTYLSEILQITESTQNKAENNKNKKRQISIQGTATCSAVPRATEPLGPLITG